MESSIQNILELPSDALMLVAGFLDLHSLNRFGRVCKTFSHVLHNDALWEILYYRQPWVLYAPKKEKIPSRQPKSTWKSTFIDFKNVVFEKFSVPVRGFNWAINSGILPPKKEIWIDFLIANRGLLLSDDQIAEIMIKSIKSKEGMAKIFFEKINVDLPLDLLLFKMGLILRPIPNTTANLVLDAICYEYTRRVLKPSAPEESVDFQNKIYRAMLLLLETEQSAAKGPKPSKQAFDEKMAQFLTHPELQKGSDKFYESITSFTIQNARTKTFAGRLTCIKKSGIAEIVYCEAVNGVFTVFKDEKKENPLQTIKIGEISLPELRLALNITKQTVEMVFEFDGEIWTTTSLKDVDDTAPKAYNGLYYNIFMPRVLPW